MNAPEVEPESGTNEEGDLASAASSGTEDVTRRSAFLYLVGPATLKGTLAFAEPPSLWNSALAGLQASLVIVIALPLFWLSSFSHLIGYAALGALPALFGRFHSGAGRRRVVAQCGFWQTASILGMSSLVCLGVGPEGLLLALALACGVLYFVASTIRPGPPGALIFIFAAGAAMANAPTWEVVLERGAATAAVSVLSWLVCVVTERLRERATPERSFPMEPQRSLQDRLQVSARVAVGAAFAVFAVHAFGASHPEWAAMGAVAVMQGVHLTVSMHRAIQRMVGTLIGALIVWMILSNDPNVWLIIACVAVFQFLTEVVIGYNYAIGQIVITPMALLMSYLASPLGSVSANIAVERVLDTVIGATIGLLFAVITSSLADRRSLLERGGR